MYTEDPALSLFVEAVKLTEQNIYVEAISKFLEVAHQYPGSHLADDALFNAGLCHFHLNSFTVAINIFRSVISDYPDADVYTDGSYREFGKTAAKCHYAIINCYLGMGQSENAANELKQLSNYPDSYIESAIGEKITFSEIGKKAIDSFKKFAVK